MKELKIYGVEFHGKSGTRTDDARGMVAEVGVDDQTVRNDFDTVLPWGAMRRCNTAIVNGERFPSRFEGDDGFDNVNADVFVYVPLFFYQRAADDSFCKVSMQQHDGFDAPRKFKRADGTLRDFVFLPAYTAGVADGKPASRSGLDPFITSLNGWMALTAGMGDLLIESTMDDEIKNILLDVEFATRDPQSIMTGAVNADDVFPSGACDNVRASSGSLKIRRNTQKAKSRRIIRRFRTRSAIATDGRTNSALIRPSRTCSFRRAYPEATTRAGTAFISGNGAKAHMRCLWAATCTTVASRARGIATCTPRRGSRTGTSARRFLRRDNAGTGKGGSGAQAPAHIKI